MKIIIRKQYGRYNFLSNDSSWCLELGMPPESGFSGSLADTFEDEPDIDEKYPSELVELIAKRQARYFIDTGREEKNKKIVWLREHAREIDSAWAHDKINKLYKEIDEINRKISDLKDFLEENNI